jgi:hypothetical protein
MVVMLKRNNDVYNYRRKLIDYIHNEYISIILKDNLTSAEFDYAGRIYDKRRNEFNRISYNIMVYYFWKKIDSFYDKNLFS